MSEETFTDGPLVVTTVNNERCTYSNWDWKVFGQDLLGVTGDVKYADGTTKRRRDVYPVANVVRLSAEILTADG